MWEALIRIFEPLLEKLLYIVPLDGHLGNYFLKSVREAMEGTKRFSNSKSEAYLEPGGTSTTGTFSEKI